MEPDTRAALLKMASRVAEQLVGAALDGMLHGQTTTHGPVTITLHPVPPRKQLAPAPHVKRKYTRRATPIAATPKPRTVADLKAARAKPAYGGTAVADRACRRCFKRGTAAPVAGTARTVKCSACGHTWDVRGLAQASAPSAKKGVGCLTCGHPARTHVEFTGQCTERTCGCQLFK